MDARTVTGGARGRFHLLGVLVIILAAGFLLLVYLSPGWWAVLPISILVGAVLGLRLRWFLAWAGGFACAFGYWVAVLLTLPAGPRESLATQLGSATGIPATLFLLLGPLLVGLLGAVGAGALAGGVRWLAEWRGVRNARREDPSVP